MRIAGNISSILEHKSGAIWAVPPETTVFEAIRLMADKNIGALLVVADSKLQGIISERDYTRNVILKGRSSKETLVRDIMTTQVISVTPQTPIEDCMAVVTANRVRHLPVLDGDTIVGVVSIGDLVKWIMSAQEATIQHLESYITGNYPG